MNDSSSRPSDLTRRNLIAASAWSVPVVAVAVSAPVAAAASGGAVGCGTDYQLSLFSPYIGQIVNSSTSVQLVSLVLSSTNTIDAIAIEDQSTFDSAYLVAPSDAGTVNGLPVSYDAGSSTGGTITMSVPAGATYTVFPDVAFPPNSGTATLTAIGGSCSPLNLVVSSG